MQEIRFHGAGGHGVVVAAKLLAEAAARAGYCSQSFASYGALRRGGEVESYVRIDDKRIAPHCKIYEADLTVLMNDEFASNPQITSSIKEGSQVLINSESPPEAFDSLKHALVATVDAAGIATENGLMLSSGVPIMNTVILGAVLVHLPDIDIEQLAAAIRDAKIPGTEKNIQAARQAHTAVKSRVVGAGIPKTTAKERTEPSVDRYPVYWEKRAPCDAACPAGEPIRASLSLVQQGRLKEALEAIRLENPFPGICGRVCHHPCEGACNRKEFDEAVSIGALERALYGLGTGGVTREPARKDKTGKAVAVIGAGPAGLSCAYFLTLLGHDVTVFETLPFAGGIPRIGIPAYRLPRDVVDAETHRLLAFGVKIRTGVEIGKEISFDEIVREFHASYIAVGAHRSARLGISGEEGPHVTSGLEFLREIALNRAKGVKRKRVAVIGGGNSAIDAARSALRMGAKEVTIIYRRSLTEMPAFPEEREAAINEGVRIIPQALPVRIERDKRRISRIECLRAEPITSGEGRPVPKSVEGTNFLIDADIVVTATGEMPDLSFLPATIERDGSVVKTDVLGRTSVPGVYAGGDAACISRTVSEAIGAGKRGAIGIDLYLRGRDQAAFISSRNGSRNVCMAEYLADEQQSSDRPIALFDDINPAYFTESPRQRAAELPVPERLKTFDEVKSDLTQQGAIQEATRCFQCGRCTLCENCYIFCSDVAMRLDAAALSPVLTRTLCERCGVCIHECPRGALSWEGGQGG